MKILKVITIAGTMSLAGTFGASAALLDFTDSSVGIAGTLGAGPGAVGYSLTAVGGTVRRVQDFDGDSSAVPAAAGLALEKDGVGVAQPGNFDDEVTNGAEQLILTFTRAIRLSGVHFLDLFVGKVAEFSLTRDGNTNALIVTTTATEPLNGGTNTGYAFSGVPNVGVSKIRFVPGGAKDDNNGDFALAAINYVEGPDGNPAPVPLPAAGFLLLGALGGLAAARRLKKA